MGVLPAEQCGTWALLQVDEVADLNGTAGGAFEHTTTAINYALSYDDITGLSVRVPWSALDVGWGGTPTNPTHAILDKAYAITSTRGLQLAVRWLAGWNCPARFFTGGTPLVDFEVGSHNDCTGYPSETVHKPSVGQEVPMPFKADGSRQTGFETEYGLLLDKLIVWAKSKATPIKLIHCPQYGQNYAELSYGSDVQNATGYTLTRFLNGHKWLIDLLVARRTADIIFEQPLSGFGSGMPSTSPPIPETLMDYALDVSRFGSHPDDYVVQANGWQDDQDWNNPADPLGTSTATQGDKWLSQVFRTTPSTRAEQAAAVTQPSGFSWPDAFTRLVENQAEYCEIYTASFAAGQPGAGAGSSVLQTQISAFSSGAGYEMGRVPFTRGPTVARFFHNPFMSYGTSAQGSLGDSAAPLEDVSLQQALDYDALLPNAPAKAYYNATRREANRTARESAVDPIWGIARGPIWYIGYNNDGAVIRIPTGGETGSDLEAAQAGAYSSLKDVVNYRFQEQNVTPTTPANRMSFVSRVNSGNYMARIWDNAYIAEHISLYKSLIDVGAQGFDGAMVDVMGKVPADTATPTPWNPDHAQPDAGGGWTALQQIAYTSQMTRKLRRGGAAAAGAQWAGGVPTFPNGLFDGAAYWDPTIDTRRLMFTSPTGGDPDGTGGMFEQWVKGENQGISSWRTTAVLIKNIDALIDSEENGRFAFCQHKLWVAMTGAEGPWIVLVKQNFRYTYGCFLLGANGYGFYSFRDDNSDGLHRTLEYPSTIPAITGDTPTTGRRHQFQSFIFAENDRWLDRSLTLGRTVGAFGMAAKPYTEAGNLFTRVFAAQDATYKGGYVYLNNNDANTGTSGMPASPKPAAGTYVEIDGTPYTFDGNTAITVPARSSVILMRTSSGGGAQTISPSGIASAGAFGTPNVGTVPTPGIRPRWPRRRARWSTIS